MRVFFLLVLLFFVGAAHSASHPPSPTPAESTAKPKENATQGKENAQTHDQATKTFPSNIEVSKPPLVQVETTDKTEKRRDYSSSEWWMVYITGTLAVITFFLAFYTARLWWATKKMVDGADATAKRQSEEMQDSIAEATRAATAMEGIADATKNNAVLMRGFMSAQMRAYLTVSIANGVYQDRAAKLKFEVNPSVLNTGHTPAHKVHYWARAAILPFPLPDDFEFTIHENPVKSSMVVGPHQGITLNAVVDDFVPDEEVNIIKSGVKKRVHIWGIITYTDAFDGLHTTKFCHSIRWFTVPENGVMVEKITGNYSYHHNEAT